MTIQPEAVMEEDMETERYTEQLTSIKNERDQGELQSQTLVFRPSAAVSHLCNGLICVGNLNLGVFGPWESYSSLTKRTLCFQC